VTLGLNCLLLQPEHVQIHGRRVKLSAEEHLQRFLVDSDSGSRKVVLYLRTMSESTAGEGRPLPASAYQLCLLGGVSLPRCGSNVFTAPQRLDRCRRPRPAQPGWPADKGRLQRKAEPFLQVLQHGPPSPGRRLATVVIARRASRRAQSHRLQDVAPSSFRGAGDRRRQTGHPQRGPRVGLPKRVERWTMHRRRRHHEARARVLDQPPSQPRPPEQGFCSPKGPRATKGLH
jgi:hypothetical protein